MSLSVNKPRVLVIGHRFIRRLESWMHSLQSLEIPCLTLVQSSLQHEDQSVSMNGLVFRIRHAA
jgi:hypothetical protein